jgi:hypothetical protein
MVARSQEKKDTIPPFIGITYQPIIKWHVFGISDGKGGDLTYTFNMNSATTYEGSFRIDGLRIGLSAQIEDNLVGKVHRWGGSVGLKNYWIKLQSVKMSGAVDWNGELPPGFLQHLDFNTTFFSIEILKTVNKKRYIDGSWQVQPVESNMGFYWGLGYMSVALPIKLRTLIEPETSEYPIFGYSAYDSLFKAQFYTACFGFDLLRQLCFTGGKNGLSPNTPPSRFGVYASTQDKIGFGQGKVSRYGVAMAEALNPGYSVTKDKYFSVAVDYHLSLGFRYLFRPKPFFVIAATGYDLGGAMVACFNGNKTHTDLNVSPETFLIHHGVSFRLLVSYIGK